MRLFFHFLANPYFFHCVMSGASLKRWRLELTNLRKAYLDPSIETGIKGVYPARDSGIAPNDFQVLRDLATIPCSFEVVIEGPADSPYANIDFPFEVSVSEEYPFKPPSVRWLYPFDNHIIRPSHFFDKGFICCHAIGKDYSPRHSLLYLLNSIREVMFEKTSAVVKSISVAEIENYVEQQEKKRTQLFLITNS